MQENPLCIDRDHGDYEGSKSTCGGLIRGGGGCQVGRTD